MKRQLFLAISSIVLFTGSAYAFNFVSESSDSCCTVGSSCCGVGSSCCKKMNNSEKTDLKTQNNKQIKSLLNSKGIDLK